MELKNAHSHLQAASTRRIDLYMRAERPKVMATNDRSGKSIQLGRMLGIRGLEKSCFGPSEPATTIVSSA